MPYLDSTPQVADQSRYPKFIRQGNVQPIRTPASICAGPTSTCSATAASATVWCRPTTTISRRASASPIRPTSKWVIRTGAGMFYNQDTGNPRFDMARNLAGRVRFNVRPADYPDPHLEQRACQHLRRRRQGHHALRVRQQVRTPHALRLEYLFNVQRELGRNLVLEAGYLGSVSRKLELLRAVNESLPGTVGSVHQPRSLSELRPHPTGGQLRQRRTTTRSASRSPSASARASRC